MSETWIDATGDVVAGDTVKFRQALFGGSFRRPVFEGYQDVEGVVLREAYGAGTGQHTFTLQTPDGGTFRIMGRNLYRNGTMRLRWPDETQRDVVATEKHRRGGRVRADRTI